MLGAIGQARVFTGATATKNACGTCPGLDHKLLPEVVHAVYLVIRWPTPMLCPIQTASNPFMHTVK